MGSLRLSDHPNRPGGRAIKDPEDFAQGHENGKEEEMTAQAQKARELQPWQLRALNEAAHRCDDLGKEMAAWNQKWTDFHWEHCERLATGQLVYKSNQMSRAALDAERDELARRCTELRTKLKLANEEHTRLLKEFGLLSEFPART